MANTLVLTHRGLEPSRPDFFSESSYEAFESQISRGFGLEFDLNFLADGEIVIAHDKDLSRITAGVDKRAFADLTAADIKQIRLKSGRLALFSELLELVCEHDVVLHALHFKGAFQNSRNTKTLIEHLKPAVKALPKLLIFDLRPDIAAELKASFPNLKLAASVSHPYDVERYNQCVSETLFTIEQIIERNELFSWAWLDEWDLSAKSGAKKSLYNCETFQILRDAGFSLGLVTPELHATSPGLLGGESHPDAADKERLFARIKEILHLSPELVCTDYPEEVRAMVHI